ncbi:MAG TPA: type II secretion system secretin GspD [Burkholderiaceae bacterium]|nr:type II secretion system secretin GspD [Burkholderiaceae bacterium]
MTRRPLPFLTVPLAGFAALLAALAIALPGTARAQAAKPAAPKAAATAPKASAKVTLNFVNADIEAVSRAMGAMLDRQILVDPRVKGTITVYSETPITVREGYLLYLAALRGLGFTVVENAGLLKVVPEADAKLQAGTVVVGEGAYRGDQILTQIFRLNHENPNNLVAVLRPLISPNNTINANPGTNSLVITDYADNLARIGKIIAALDQPSASDIDVVPLKSAVASDLAPLVQRLADGSSTPAAPGAAGASSVSVIADSRSNALIVRSGSPARQAQVRAIIDKLDRPAQGGGPAGNIWVVHLKHADAVKIAQVLRAAFATGGGAPSGAVSAPSPTAAGAGANPGASPATTPVQASQGPSTGGFIQADPSTNSLIITAAEPLYRQVRAMIDQIDTRRAQVYIESLIVEVSGDNAADVGFQWQGLIGKDGDRNLVGIGTNLGNNRVPSIVDITTSAASGTVTVGAGLNIGLVRNFGGTYALSAIAQLLQTQSNTNIMSTPNLITLDNEEAKIVVGRNVPFITGQFTNTGTGTTNPFQTIERKDVGLTLRIKPQIGEGGTVRMTIFQESSDVIGQATGTSGAGPTTSKRSIESNVVVDDGSILVLGGLIEDRFEDSKSKVPLLGDIPGIGGLFRSESRTKKRTNLMVFLRPVVMRTAEDATKLSLDRYDMIRAQQQASQPAPNMLLDVGRTPVAPERAVAPAGGASAPALAPAASAN